MKTTAKREWTANLPKGVETLVLCSVPMHAGEHMIHAWDALRAIGMDPGVENFAKNRVYAHARFEGCKAALKSGAKVKYRNLFDAELSELEIAINTICP
jgi:hypothetical protein